MPAQRRNTGSSSWHVGVNSESSLLQQSGTEVYPATRGRTVRHAQTRTVPKFAHTEASNVHELGPAITPHSEMMSKNLRAKTRSGPNIGSCPPGQSNIGSTLSLQPNSHFDDTTTKKTTKNGDKRKEMLRTRNMDRMAGFDGGPFTAPARSTRRRVQGETGAVPVPVPGKGTRPSPVQSTSIEMGKSKENGQANQVSRSSSFANIEREGVENINGSSRPGLHWGNPKKKCGKRQFITNIGETDIIDVDKDALDAERQKKAAMLKRVTFSKKKVKEEMREEEDVLRVGMGDAHGIGDRGSKESDDEGESREATVGEVNGETLEQVPPQREHSPWTCDGQGNIPGLSAPSRSARLHGPYNLPQAAGLVNVETRVVPIPLPSLFPDPPDTVSDISDDDLYLPKEVEKVGAPQVQVKEEQREDQDVFFGFPILDLFPDLQTPISAPTLEQNAASEPANADNSASYPLDTECTIHPKNKRKQHNLSQAKNAPSPKKVKTDVCALNVGEGQCESNRKIVHVQGEDGGEVPLASIPAPQKKTRRSKKKKGKGKKKDVPIDQVETHIVTIGQEVPLTGSEDEMEICAIETKQGEIPSGDALSLAASGAVSTADPSYSQTGIGETIGRKESESTGETKQDELVKAGTDISVTPSAGPLPASESAEQDECVKAGTEISVIPPSTDPLPASVHDATKVEPLVPDSIITKSSRKGKRKGQAAENGAGSTDKAGRRKRDVRGQATEAGEQTQNRDVNPVGDKEISHPGETPRKRRKKGQVTEGIDCQGLDAGAGPAGDGEEPRPDETPRERTGMNDQTTESEERESAAAGDEHIPRQEETPRKMDDQTPEGGERTEGDPAGDEYIPQQGETPIMMNDQRAEGGERTEEGLAEDEHIPQQGETSIKMNDQTAEGGERTEEGPAGDEHLPQQEKTPKKGRKEKYKTTEGGENIQGSSAGSTAADDIARTPKKKGKATDKTATDGAPEAKKKAVRGRPPKEKKNDEDINGETSMVKLTEENGPAKEAKMKTPRGRKKRATMDEGVTDGVVRKKKRALDEAGDGNRQSGKTVKSTVKWMLVCKNRTATGRKASRQGKGKEKAQFTVMAPDLDVNENQFMEETEDNTKNRKTLRPSIWASSKTELLLVLPELSGSKCFNGITEGSSNFPMVMLDESTAEGIGVDVRWFDGQESESSPSVRLTLTRDFVCPVPERASTGGTLMDSVAYTGSSDAGPSSGVGTQPNAPSSAAPGPSSVLNAYGNGWGPLPVVLPYDDNDGMDLEYIDEDVPQKMSPGFLTPTVAYAPPVAQEATTAHISHKMQSFLQAPAFPTYYPAIQFSPYNPTTIFTPSTISIPSREATTTAHVSHKVQSSLQTPAVPTYHPAIQFSPYNPATLSTPSTISIPSLQIQHFLPFHPDQIPFPQYGNTAPVPIPIPSKIPFYDEEPSPPTPSELKSELDIIIPPSPPPEIEILTSSKRLSLPFILISSHETFKRHFWGPLTPPPYLNGPGDSPEQAKKVGLAAEHAYVFLGFFRVVKMGERRVTLSDEERVNLTPGKVAGRVEWTFDVEWVPGYHGSKGSEELNRPWWAPDLVFGRPVGRERESKKGSTWLEKHAQARLNLLPMQLVDGQEAGSSDEAMPKGWLCKTCGKLNQKIMMRHRWCGSRMCRDNPLSRGYAVNLSSARDANQTPLALPISTCNRRTVDASVADWDDGMRTLKYRPMAIPDRLGNAGARSGILQHVFTCNLVGLQTEATSLFESIQSEVCLMKSTGDSGPFFKSHVSDSYANQRDKYAFSCLSWSEAPQVVKDARELMTFMGKEYGEEEMLDIDKLTIVGWVSSGSRKTPTILAAREHAITVLCLGNDVVLTIVPKWEVSVPVPGSLQLSNLSYPSYLLPFAPDAEMANHAALPPSMPILPRVANFAPSKIQSTLARTPRPIIIKPPSANQMQLVDVAAAPATENHVRQVGAISENPPSGVVPAQITSRNSRSKPASKLKPKTKQASESMSVTLVHGDMLLFSGCDFEYSIKRMGTSILVIGSKEDSTASI